MKKILTISILMMLVLVGFASAATLPARQEINVQLLQKDATTWTPIVNGITGSLFGYQYYQNVWVYNPVWKVSVKTTVLQDYLWFQSWNAKPNTAYTLIYYGFEGNNDVWPYATCIASKTSSSMGYLTLDIKDFKWSSFMNDGINQKFWLVRSSDVDCANHQMTAWNPANYLFESKTI